MIEMNQYIVGRREELGPSLLLSLMAYRYEVFVRKLGWELPGCEYGVEQDEFDTPECVYMVCRRDDGEIVGCGRLLPTSQPYLLQKVFPCLVEGGGVPRSSLTWELSRFAAVPLGPGCVATATLSAEVFCASLRTAAELGATQVVGVLSIALERMCRGFGIRLERLGRPHLYAGQRIVACVTDVSKLQPYVRPHHENVSRGRELPTPTPSWSHAST